ncbi:MAG: acireductone dioxygenase, partial [Actinomycetia bacterium]|nr:acireductone dioxygenase [Actinomycetes bacterium]
GVFGVVLPDGKQVELTVEASEFIGVPKGTEHWFRLTERQQIKVVRYFSEVDSWQAEFTGTQIRFG